MDHQDSEVGGMIEFTTYRGLACANGCFVTAAMNVEEVRNLEIMSKTICLGLSYYLYNMHAQLFETL